VHVQDRSAKVILERIEIFVINPIFVARRERAFHAAEKGSTFDGK